MRNPPEAENVASTILSYEKACFVSDIYYTIRKNEIERVITMKRSKQMSESIELGIVLALAGGFMDAYSYMCRGEVFANAQTGNMLLFGIYVSEGKWNMAFRYVFPVLAFIIGIAIADVVRMKFGEKDAFHWRQIAVFFEAVVLICVSFMPQNLNLLANSMTSLACGIQVESFRKIHGNAIATTMCIGNLRSGTQNLCEYLATKDRKTAQKCLLYYGIIVSFIVGAIIGNIFVKLLDEKAILLCAGILGVAFLMMFVDKERKTVVEDNSH